MSITQHPAARRIRAAVLTAAAGGIGLAGLLGASGVAHASTTGYAIPHGFTAVTSCTSVQGQISYSPGLLTSKAKAEHAVLTGTTSGCSNIFSGAMSGSGTLTAILSGNASSSSENLSGTFTINWPASTGDNPSDGRLTVTGTNGAETISGTVTSGFDTGSELSLGYVTTGNTGNGTARKPVTAQAFVNTRSLTLSENEG
jgi:hypothetical protein